MFSSGERRGGSPCPGQIVIKVNNSLHFVLIDFDLISNFVGTDFSHCADNEEECGGSFDLVQAAMFEKEFSEREAGGDTGGDTGGVGKGADTVTPHSFSCLSVRPSLQLE